MKTLMFLSAFLGGCFIPIVEDTTPITPQEAREACWEFCKPRAQILERRDKTTYFCSCLNSLGQTIDNVVVGKIGTIYR